MEPLVPDDHVRSPVRWAAPILGGALLLLAFGWIATLAWALATTAPVAALTPLRISAWIGLGSGPLALLAILAVLAFRTGAIDTDAFMRRSRALQRESDRLAVLLGLINRRIDEARAGLAAQGAELMAVGATAGDRMVAASHALRTEAEAFALLGATVDTATAQARTDIGVLLADLPDAETRARALGDQLRSLGAEAADRSAELGDRLALIETHATAAGNAGATASQRLAGELERIGQGAAAAEQRLTGAADMLGRTGDDVLANAATAFEHVRQGIADQAAAVAALVAQARGSFGHATDESARGLARQLDALDQRIDAMSGGLRDQEGAARHLLGQLDLAIGALEQRFSALGDEGTARVADLADAIVGLSDHAQQVGHTLGQGALTAESLLGRAEALRIAVEASSGQIGETIPAALARLRLHADQGLQAIGNAGARTEKLVADAASLNERLGETAALIDARAGGLDRLGAEGEARLAALLGRLGQIGTAAEQAERTLSGLTDSASPALAEALGRMKAAAAEAAEAARDSIGRAIPAAADALAESTAKEVAAALAGVGRTELAHVGIASAQAVEAARGASEQLTRQLLVIADTTRALDQRIADHRRAADEADEAGFARAAGLLIEALNSTAIDVAKLFSNDPTDTAWAAYLKGDRGIFTRRAVRLLDNAEAKAIGQRYLDDPEFHAQLDRYIHDFEMLLRRLMSVREGETMSIALLSSDLGKLYVALAQAIERLRK